MTTARLVWTGTLQKEAQALERGFQEVWLLTRPGHPVPDINLPVAVVPEEIECQVEAPFHEARGFAKSHRLSLPLSGPPQETVLCMGKEGEIFISTEQTTFNITRVDLAARVATVFESYGPRELEGVAVMPDGRLFPVGASGEYSIFDDSGKEVIKHGPWGEPPPFERPRHGMAFWDHLGDARDLSCGEGSFVVATINAEGHRVFRYSYAGRLLQSLANIEGGWTEGETPLPAAPDWVCLDRRGRLWVVVDRGEGRGVRFLLFSPEGDLLLDMRARDFPPAHPELQYVDWFGVDSHCRPWIYQNAATWQKGLRRYTTEFLEAWKSVLASGRREEDSYQVVAGYDLGLDC